MTAVVLAALLACVSQATDQDSSDTGGAVAPGPSGDTGELSDPIDELDGSTLPAGNTPCREPVKGKVVEVIDGDTIKVDVDGDQITFTRVPGAEEPE